MSTALAQSRSWKRPPLIRNAWLRWALYLGVLVYLVAALNSIEVNWVRVSEGLAQGWRFAQTSLRRISSPARVISGGAWRRASP
jgi:phosphonate transport system permease protein